jgi:hypothetical protein
VAKKKRGGKGRFKSKRALSAQIGLGSLINKARKNESFRNDPAEPSSVIKDMPDKFQKFIGRNLRPDGTMNSAAQAIFDFYDDGRSEFQRELNRNIQSNPQFAQAYAERFPKTALAMKGLPMLFQAAGSAIAPGFGLAAEAFKGAKAKASDIGTTLRESFAPTFAGVKELLTPDLGGGPGPLTRDQNTANTEAMNLAALDVGRDDDIFTGPDVQSDFISATPNLSLAANPNIQRIFALPSGQTASFTTQSLTDPTKANMTRGNYLVNDPGGFLRMTTLPTGMAQGGIASLQDPNYNLLMEASDFSL